MLFVLKKVDWLRISFILIPVTTGHGNWCTCAACSKNIAPHFKEVGRKLAYIGGGWVKEWGTETTARQVLTLNFGWMQISNKKVSWKDLMSLEPTRYFLPVKIEKRTCDISSATIDTLFLCCVCVWTKIQERCCCLCFVILTQRDMCKSRTLQHIHNMRREKRKKNCKIDESSKIERMILTCKGLVVTGFWNPPPLRLDVTIYNVLKCLKIFFWHFTWTPSWTEKTSVHAVTSEAHLRAVSTVGESGSVAWLS